MKQALARDIVEYSPEGIILIDLEGTLQYLNESAKNLFSFYEFDDWVGESVYSLFTLPEFRPQLSQNLQALKAQEVNHPIIFGSLVNSSSSEVFEVEIVATRIGASEIFAALGSENEETFALYLRDVSVRKALQNQITQQANLDALTGINNRRNFFEKTKIEFRRSLRHPYPICMLWIGLDLFKGLNEKHGTQAGDQVLIAFSDMLRQHMRDEDIVARMSSAEFAILLPHLSLSHAHKVGEKLRNYVEKTTVQFGDLTLRFTISVGVTLWNRTEEFDELLLRGQSALAHCVKKGRNCVSEDT